MSQEGSHHVHLGMGRGRLSAGMVDFFEDDGCLGHAETGTTVLGWDQCAEPAGLRERLYELLGISAVSVSLSPVFAAKALTQLTNSAPNSLLMLAVPEVHVSLPRVAPLGVGKGALLGEDG